MSKQWNTNLDEVPLDEEVLVLVKSQRGVISREVGRKSSEHLFIIGNVFSFDHHELIAFTVLEPLSETLKQLEQ